METIDFIYAGAGGLISLILAYFPVLSKKYEILLPGQKALINVMAMVAISLLLFGISCLGWAEGLGVPDVTCTEKGALELLKIFFLVLLGNSSTYTGVKHLGKQ
jgi:hypothetical protein